MIFRPLLLASVCALAATLGACDGDRGVRISSSRNDDTDAKGVLKVVQALQCPQTMGSLTRKGTATAGGNVCSYVGPKGAEVSLHLVALNDEQPGDLLKAFEDRLSGDLPDAVAQLKASAEAEKARTAAEVAHASAEEARATAEAARARATDAAASGDHASVRAPGVRIEADGDDASVNLPGIHIQSQGDNASVQIGGFHIDANDNRSGGRSRGGDARVHGTLNGDEVSVQAHNDTAEIRTRAGGDATRASWILSDNRVSQSGWRFVGYEARGPAGGPIVVATVRSRDRQRGHVFEDAKALVTLNVGD